GGLHLHEKRPPRSAEAVGNYGGIRNELFQVAAGVHGDAAGTLVFLGLVFLAGSHGLGAPFLGLGNVLLNGVSVAVVDVGLAAIGQVEIGHGIVVVGAVLDGLVEVLQAFINQRLVLDGQILHDLLG